MYTPVLHYEIARQRQDELRREASARRRVAEPRRDTEEPFGLLRLLGLGDRLSPGRPAVEASA